MLNKKINKALYIVLFIYIYTKKKEDGSKKKFFYTAKYAINCLIFGGTFIKSIKP